MKCVTVFHHHHSKGVVTKEAFTIGKDNSKYSIHPEIFDRTAIGREQYIFTSAKGVISLVYLPNIYGDGRTQWHLYAFDNKKLFKGTKEFLSMKGAEGKIKELLEN